MTVEIRALEVSDDRSAFHSGDEALDLFFHRYAGQNQFRHHIGVTYVAVEGARILGFATVSPGSLDADDLPAGRKLPPYPIPILRVARLAVDASLKGQGLGRSLLRFCLELAEGLRDNYGCAGVVVDAKPDAEGFCEAFGFEAIEPLEGAGHRVPRPTMMYLPLGSIPGRTKAPR